MSSESYYGEPLFKSTLGVTTNVVRDKLFVSSSKLCFRCDSEFCKITFFVFLRLIYQPPSLPISNPKLFDDHLMVFDVPQPLNLKISFFFDWIQKIWGNGVFGISHSFGAIIVLRTPVMPLN